MIQYSPLREEHLAVITELIQQDLSEPYSVYTYRYFLHQWPRLSYLVCPASLSPLPL